jgi:hypothetical protein
MDAVQMGIPKWPVPLCLPHQACADLKLHSINLARTRGSKIPSIRRRSIRTCAIGHPEHTTPTAIPRICAATIDVNPEGGLDPDKPSRLVTQFGVTSHSEKDPLPYRTKPNYWDPVMLTMRSTWRRIPRPFVIASLSPPIRHTQG